MEAHEVEEMKTRLEWKELEKRLTGSVLEGGDNSSSIYIPGGGIAKSLFEEWYVDEYTFLSKFHYDLYFMQFIKFSLSINSIRDL